MEDKIKDLLKDYESRHSEYQIDNFIVAAQGDNWSMYKQALREIASRYESLLSQKEDLELYDLQIKFYWPFGRQAEIKKKRRIRHRAALVESVRETERELGRFVVIATQLKEVLGIVNSEKRKKFEAGSWCQKAIRMSALDLLVNRGISHATMDFILKLSIKDRRKVINMISPAANPDPLKLLGMYED